MAPEIEKWLALKERNFGDTLDAMVEAIADMLPAQSPFTRLSGHVALTLPRPKGMPDRLADIAGTITCYFGTKEDMRWALEFFGPPTSAVPGHSVSWNFGPAKAEHP